MARPLAEIPALATKSRAWLSCRKWGNGERSIAQAWTLTLGARVDPGAIKGNLWPTVFTVAASLTPRPLLQISSLGPLARNPEGRAPETRGGGSDLAGFTVSRTPGPTLVRYSIFSPVKSCLLKFS